MGLEQHERDTCECGWPIEIAWHADMEGWFEGRSFVCHACSASAGREVTHTLKPTTDRNFAVKPLSDFDWETTTTSPTEHDDETDD